MDAALDKINIVQNDEINSFYEARHLFEEVLSHAMSIAQVSLAEDSKIIRGSCQSVSIYLLILFLKSTIKSIQGDFQLGFFFLII